jgi:hypothetical protein
MLRLVFQTQPRSIGDLSRARFFRCAMSFGLEFNGGFVTVARHESSSIFPSA